MIVVSILLVLAGVGLRVTLPRAQEPSPDEAAYTIYATEVVHNGPSQVAAMVRAYGTDPRLGTRPSPTRAGYVLLVAGAMRLTGFLTRDVAVQISALSSIAALALGAWTAWRFFGPGAAAIALCFMLASPMDLAIARRAWQDGILGLLALGVLYALLAHRAGGESTENPAGAGSRAAWAAAGLLLGACALLVKETGLLLLGVGTLGFAWADWRASRPRSAAFTMIAGVLALAAAAGTLVALCGGFEPTWTAITHMIQSGNTSDYTREFQTGSPLYYVTGLGILQPIPLAIGLAAALLVILRVPLRFGPWATPEGRAALGITAWFVVALAAVAAFYPQKNLRLLTPIYAPLHLLAGALVYAGIEALEPRLARPVLAAVVIVVGIALSVMALQDLGCVQYYFVRLGVPDLVTPMLTGAAGS